MLLLVLPSFEISNSPKMLHSMLPECLVVISLLFSLFTPTLSSPVEARSGFVCTSGVYVVDTPRSHC